MPLFLPLSRAHALTRVLAALVFVFALFSLATVTTGCGRSDPEPVTFGDEGGVDIDSGVDSGVDTCGSFGCEDSLPDIPDGPRVLVAINIEPASLTVPVGSKSPVAARGFYSDGTSDDVTFIAAWSSDNNGVASAFPGTVIGNGPGSARIRATVGGIFGEADVIVPSSSLIDLRIDPPGADLAIGASQRFTATAFFSDGSSANVSDAAAWTIASFATVDRGLVTGVSPGSGTLRADFSGRSAFAKVSVTGKTLSRLEIAPTGLTVGRGVTVKYTATAIYTDGSKADVTFTSKWSSSAPDVVSIVPTIGVATTMKPGSAVITAAFSGLTASTPITVTGAPLASVTVSPSSATISVFGTASLKATANFTDGTSTDVTASAIWKSSDPTIATVGSGMVTGTAAGSTTITASFGGMSGTSAITVSPAKLLSITISPSNPTVPLGATVPLKATGTYEGGGTRDITADVTWSTDDASVATISNAPGSQGKATPVAVGKTIAHAKLSGIDATTVVVVSAASVSSITIAPNPLALVQGDKQFVTAQAKYTDGTTVDVTTTCTWSSANNAVATVSNGAGSQGQVAGVGAGSTTISCAFSGVTGAATVNVSSPTLEQVTISPIAPSCRVGDMLQFFAQAIDTSGRSSNVTFAATWSSDAPSIVQFTGAPGRFRCMAKGSANVSATYSGKTGSTPVSVSDAVITSIQVDPVDAHLAVGDDQQYQAVALYSDGTSANVTFAATWLSTNPSVVSIGDAGPGKGRAHALSAGGSTIRATFSGVTGSTTVTVSSATVVSISINPASRSAPAGARFGYTAQAIYSDGTSKDVTGAATWSSSDPSIASVSDAFGSKGQATLLKAGSVTVKASFSGVTGTASLTVTAATVTSVQVTPFSTTIAPGLPLQYRADAIYSDGTSADVTGAATWVSSNTSVATISDAFGSKGRAQAVASGTTTIRATYAGVTGSATLNVSSATLTTIQVTPFRPTIPIGFSERMTATGLYSDGSKADLTGLATWTSSNTSVAAVSDAFGSKGRVDTLGAGTATIKATFNGVNGTDDVTVSSATLTSIAITPNPAAVAVSGNTPLTATGAFSDGTTLDITDRVTWTSSDASIADISNAGATTGVAYGFKVGTVTVTAQRGGVKGTATLNVK